MECPNCKRPLRGSMPRCPGCGSPVPSEPAPAGGPPRQDETEETIRSWDPERRSSSWKRALRRSDRFRRTGSSVERKGSDRLRTPSERLLPRSSIPELYLVSPLLARPVPLHRAPVTVGRDRRSSIRFPTKQVSRRHCEIRWDGIGYAIIDRGSTNGTYVNEVRIRRSHLNSGDIVRVGPFEIWVSNRPQMPEAPASEDDDKTMAVDHPSSVFSGDIGKLPATEILRILGFNMKTGVLEVEKNRERAYIYFRNGRILEAEHGQSMGREALFAILSFGDGHFRFSESEVDPPRESIGSEPESVLLEFAKHLDDLER